MASLADYNITLGVMLSLMSWHTHTASYSSRYQLTKHWTPRATWKRYAWRQKWHGTIWWSKNHL